MTRSGHEGGGNARIRPAGPADRGALARLCAAALPLDPDAADLAGLFTASPATVTLVAEADGVITGVGCGALGQPAGHPATGYVDLLAVGPGARNRGTGSRLLGALEDALRDRGAAGIRLGGNSGVYAWPGIDPRYTAMICLAERTGYQRCGEGVNMAVDLRATALDTGPAERLLSSGGITVRRAGPEEAGQVTSWLRDSPWGGSSWPEEARRALARDPSGCHVACDGESYVAFACHGAYRDGWFGPTGTLESHRRRGIGAVLLMRCLADIRAAGHRSAQIGWVGPVGFYARAAGAAIDRVFWMYRKELP